MQSRALCPSGGGSGAPRRRAAGRAGRGDSIVAAFSRGSDAVAAALEVQRRMGAHAWPEGPPLRVRVALHTAEAQLRDEGNYFGLALSRCARISSPVRFTRRVSHDAEVGGVRLRGGDRVAMLFGSANMDERRYPDPTRFDLNRPPGGNLGWGNGPHTCIGIHLAKLEMQAPLRALVAHVETIETIEDPQRIRNNTLQGSRLCLFIWLDSG